eukprot:1161191-Pelagomonas_calceolata.AAC.9
MPGSQECQGVAHFCAWLAGGSAHLSACFRPRPPQSTAMPAQQGVHSMWQCTCEKCMASSRDH